MRPGSGTGVGVDRRRRSGPERPRGLAPGATEGDIMGRFRWVAVLGAVALATALTAGSAVAQSGSPAKEPLRATDVGVSPTEIRVGVIADTGSQFAPGLFQGAVDAVKAWAQYTNEVEGGLAGRKVVVDVYDSGLDPVKSRNAIIEACAKDFVIVGTSALFLNNVDDLLTCPDGRKVATGLPDFPVLTTEVAHQCSPVSHGINPPIIDCATKDQKPQTYRGSVGATNYYLKKYGKKNLHGLFVYPSDVKAAKNTQVPAFKAQQDAGIKQDATFDISATAQQSAYTPLVQAIKDKQSTYARHGGNDAGTIALMKEAKLQGVNSVKVWDCSLQCYDEDILKAPETEGLYVWSLFLPFDEANQNKMLKNYTKYVGKKADGFGAQAWASGILVRDVVNQIVEENGPNGLTRAAMLQTVDGITDFTADGMLGNTNPGERVPSPCYVLTQVKKGKFVRVWPEKKGTFDCKNELYEIKLDLN
jgi:hypothetical protein